MRHALERQLERIGKKLEVLVWFIVFEESKKQPYDSGCNAMRVKMVLEDICVKENDAEMQVT